MLQTTSPSDITNLEERAKVELSRFFQLATRLDDMPTMFSGFIDNVWHEMLHDADSYNAFCLDACGQIVGHMPIKGSGKVTWIALYEEQFGQLDAIWFMDEYGEINIDAYENYLNRGEVYCSWDCSPIIDDMN